MAFGNKVRVFLLGDEAKSHEERHLVRKLDFFILTYCCFSAFVNFLDRAAFANAYVAGLRESLDMSGHDYNNVLAVTSAGLTIGQIPHGIIIQKIKPKIWLPLMVATWALLTMCSAAVKNTAQLCVIRFFLGFTEASSYSGTIYIIGSWYKPREIAKRTAIFTGAGQVGTMFAGIMMTAIYKGMAGLAGLAGWQWVFIIDGIITLPIAAFGFAFLPEISDIANVKYLTDVERKLAVQRVPPVQASGHDISPLSLLKRVFLSKTFWILFFWSPVCSTLEAFTVQSCFLIWLKYQSEHFSQTQINTYPLGIQAVTITTTLLGAWHMDVTGTRIPMAVLTCLLQLVVGVMLLIPSLPFAGTFFAFYLNGTSYIVNPLIYGWANIILQRSGDDAVRSVALYAMNIGSQTLYTFWGVVFYSAADAPYWKKGAIVLIVCCFIMFAYMGVVYKLDKDTLKNYGEHRSDDVEPESITGNNNRASETQTPENTGAEDNSGLQNETSTTSKPKQV